MSPRRFIAALVVLLLVAAVAFVFVGYKNATAAPQVRRLILHVPDYPASAAPVRIALFSDLHVHGPDMPPARLASIVEQINALHPDIDVIAGDFVGDNWIGAHYPVTQAVAPLGGLKARLGVYAVLGNNDYHVGVARLMRALAGAGVHVLVNEAVGVGPLALGGIDGSIGIADSEWMTRRKQTYAALDRTRGIKVLVAHRPDEFRFSPSWVSILLAGHTHCGQIVLPIVGPLETGSDFGRKYLCGVIRDGPRTLLVTAGLGTSHVPLRIAAPPDIWLVEITG